MVVNQQMHQETDATQQAVVAAGEGVEAVKRIIQAVADSVAANVGTTWRGLEPVMFQQTHMKWEEAMMRVGVELDRIGLNTGLSRKEYIVHDEQKAADHARIPEPFGGLLGHGAR